MTTEPWLKFYTVDWRGDVQIGMCSLAARGLWVEMLCLMHGHGGTLKVAGRPLSVAQLAIQSRGTEAEVRVLLDELERAGVFSRDEDGAIFSRRMRRDIAKVAAAKESGSQGGSPKLTGGYNKPGFVYVMGYRRRDGAVKIGISKTPNNRLKKVREQYRNDDIRVVETWPVYDMGKAEATAHRLFREKKVEEWFVLSDDERETLRRTLKGLAKGPSKGPPKGPLKGSRACAPEARGQNPDIKNPSGEATDEPSPGVARAIIWSHYPAALAEQSGLPLERVRRFLGLMLKSSPAIVVLDVLKSAIAAGTGDPLAYIAGALKSETSRHDDRASIYNASRKLQDDLADYLRANGFGGAGSIPTSS